MKSYMTMSVLDMYLYFIDPHLKEIKQIIIKSNNEMIRL